LAINANIAAWFIRNQEPESLRNRCHFYGRASTPDAHLSEIMSWH
jgi:hypothetical protein